MDDTRPLGPTKSAAAHHEAGHAVAAVSCVGARPLESVYIVQGERPSFVEGEPSWTGETVATGAACDWEYLAEQLRPKECEAAGVGLAAGRAAHERLLGNGITPAISDFWSTLDDEGLEGLSIWMVLQVIEADATDTDLDAAKQHRPVWVSEMRERAHLFVEENWAAVTMVAEALMTAPGHRLTGDQVRYIVVNK